MPWRDQKCNETAQHDMGAPPAYWVTMGETQLKKSYLFQFYYSIIQEVLSKGKGDIEKDYKNWCNGA